MLIKDQFAGSPASEEFRVLTVGVTGTVTQFITGTALMFYMKADPNNSGNIFYTNRSDGIAFVSLSSDQISPWIPGNRIDHYYWFGDTAGDKVQIHILK